MTSGIATPGRWQICMGNCDEAETKSEFIDEHRFGKAWPELAL